MVLTSCNTVSHCHHDCNVVAQIALHAAERSYVVIIDANNVNNNEYYRILICITWCYVMMILKYLLASVFKFAASFKPMI